MFTTPTGATNATKYRLEPVLKTCLKTGNALYAGQQKRAFALWVTKASQESNTLAVSFEKTRFLALPMADKETGLYFLRCVLRVFERDGVYMS